MIQRAMPRSTSLLMLGGALVATGRAVDAQSGNVVVRMGAQAVETAAEPYFGDAAGIFGANGISAQITNFGNGAAMLQAVAAGVLDVGESNPLQLALAMTRNIPVQAIAVGGIYDPKVVRNANIVVAKNSPMRTPKDLLGATVGLGALGDFNQLSFFAWLEANGIARTSVKFVEVPFSEIGPALQRGQIQIGFTTEPFKSLALKAGQIREFGDTYPAVSPVVATLVWFASQSWISGNPAVAKRLAKSVYAIGAWANAHHDAVAHIVADVTKTELAVVNSVPRRLFADHFDPHYLENTLSLAVRYGFLPRPLTVSEFVAPL